MALPLLGRDTRSDISAVVCFRVGLGNPRSSGNISETELEIWKKEVNQAYLILYNNPIKYSKLILKYLNSGFDLNAIEGELEKLSRVLSASFRFELPA